MVLCSITAHLRLFLHTLTVCTPSPPFFLRAAVTSEFLQCEINKVYAIITQFATYLDQLCRVGLLHTKWPT